MTFQHLRLLFLSFFILSLSCSKPNDNPTPPASPGNPNNPSAPGATDSLLSWKVTGNIPNNKGLWDIWFTSPSRGFAAGTDGDLYQTPDSGKTWAKIPNTTSSGMFNLFFVTAKIGFAQGNHQLQVTKDGGDTWSLSRFSFTAGSIYFSTPSTGFVSGVSDGELYKTVDTGRTWQFNTNGLVVAPVYFLSPNKGFLLSSGGTLFKTLDGAATWQRVNQQVIFTLPRDTIPSFALQFIDTLTGYIAGRNGVLKTTDGGLTWTNTLHVGGRVNVIKFFTTNLGYYKSDSVIYKTTNGGQTWTLSCRLTSDRFTGMFFIDSTTGWACGQKGSIIRIDHQ